MAFLILGFLISVSRSFILNERLAKKIEHVRNYDAPIVRKSVQIKENYDKLTEIYENTVLIGDKHQLSESETLKRNIIEQLESLTTQHSFNEKQQIKSSVTDIIDRLKENNTVIQVYTQLIDAGDSPSEKLQHQAAQIAEKSFSISDALYDLVEQSEEHLSALLSEIRHTSAVQTRANIIIMGIVLFITVLLVALNINYFTLAPIRSLLKAIHNNEEVPKEMIPDNEIGEISRNFMQLMNEQRSISRNLTTEIDLRVEIETKLRKHEALLEKRVRERTQQLAQNRVALEEENRRTQQYLDVAGVMLLALDCEGIVTMVNKKGCEIIGLPVDKIIGCDWFENFIIEEEQEEIKEIFNKALNGEIVGHKYYENAIRTANEEIKIIGWHNSVTLGSNQEINGVLSSGTDLTQTREMESELRQSQKLESVGQLAAGIAHEINTPIQFVGDNLSFLKDAMSDLFSLAEGYEQLIRQAEDAEVDQAIIQTHKESKEDADLKYLKEEVPTAIQQSLDGVSRVANIVRAMKEFSHPGSADMTHADLNAAIKTTSLVAKNEWKYISELITDFDETLPLVPCLIGEFNQIILNMIVNARDAIAELVDESDERGTITITTKHDNQWAIVHVRDTGAGMPDHVKKRIFDPFFTTKEVGKGSGQGLAIARSVIEKHKGQLLVDSAPGKGTTFTIKLPLTTTNESN